MRRPKCMSTRTVKYRFPWLLGCLFSYTKPRLLFHVSLRNSSKSFACKDAGSGKPCLRFRWTYFHHCPHFLKQPGFFDAFVVDFRPACPPRGQVACIEQELKKKKKKKKGHALSHETSSYNEVIVEMIGEVIIEVIVEVIGEVIVQTRVSVFPLISINTDKRVEPACL